MLCKAMEWNHLPASGGVFDQDPQLLVDWAIIWGIEAEAEERKQNKQKRDAERNAQTASSQAPPRTVNPL